MKREEIERLSDLTADEQMLIKARRSGDLGRVVMSPEILSKFEGLSEADQERVLEFARSLLMRRQDAAAPTG